MSKEELTMEKFKKLFEAAASSHPPSEVIVMMDDEAFEKAKAAGLNVYRTCSACGTELIADEKVCCTSCANEE